MTAPWYTLGADRAVMRERRIVIQSSDGHDLILLGRDDDGRWTLTFLEENGVPVLKSGEFAPGLYGMQALDNQGGERVRIGELSPERFGLRVRNAASQVVYEVDNGGQTLPYLVVPMGSTGGVSGMAIQSGSYGGDGIYYADWYCTAPRVRVIWGCSFPLVHTSTMDVRVRSYVNGSYTTLSETKGLNTSSTGTVDAQLPSGAVGTVIRVQVEARRASGADTLGLQIVAHPRNYG
jgi:hypothetical protein